MNCTKCATEVRDGSSFCTSCGAPFLGEPPRIGKFNGSVWVAILIMLGLASVVAQPGISNSHLALAGISERQALSNLIRFSRSRDPIIKYDSLSTPMSRVDVSASLAGLEHRDVQLFPIINGWE